MGVAQMTLAAGRIHHSYTLHIVVVVIESRYMYTELMARKPTARRADSEAEVATAPLFAFAVASRTLAMLPLGERALDAPDAEDDAGTVGANVP